MGTKKRTPVSPSVPRTTSRKGTAAKAKPKAAEPTPPAAPDKRSTELESKVLDSLLSVIKKIRQSLSS